MDRALWRRADDLAFVESPDRVVLILLRQLERPPLILEGSAAAIWSVLDDRRTTDEVVEQVAHLHAVEGLDIHDDVASFLGVLQDEGLVMLDA